jgi:FMN-dependent oxidoreductase (nitrilotriacetate monooxygenase family)
MRSEEKMRLALFIYPTGHHIAAWRMPGSVADAGINFKHYADMAKIAEAARFDMIFLADSNTIGSNDPKSLFRISTRYLCQFEPLVALGGIAAVTERIGLVATATTSYSEPYTLARQFASLDHMSAGRTGWNVVTSGEPLEAQNFGREAHLDGPTRYARAKEYVEVANKLWDSWEDDAFVRDKEAGVFFDPEKLHVTNHSGEFFKVRGPLNIARSPQGRPVIVQAGASEAGRELSAQYGEVIFGAPQNGLEPTKVLYADVKGRMAKYGRQPDDLKLMLGLFPVVGATKQEAERKFEQLMDMVHPDLIRQNIQQITGLDVSNHDLDAPAPRDLPDTDGMKAKRDFLVEVLREKGMTLRKLYRKLGAARGHKVVVGTAKEIADEMEEWFVEKGCDGYLVMPPYFPAPLTDFTTEVVPELQRRKLFRTEYEGKTLRENLGLPYPKHFAD